MKQGPEKKQVNVEDLLRLKRSEAPAPEFWAGWQRDMRTKLGRAAQEKRSWWSLALPRFWITVARWHVPLGASALAALAFVAIREYDPALPALASHKPQVENDGMLSVLASETVSEGRAHIGADADSTLVPGEVSRLVTMMAPSESMLSPAARTIAANLAYAQSMDSELAPLEIRTSSPSFSIVSSPEANGSHADEVAQAGHRGMLSRYQLASYNEGVSAKGSSEVRPVTRLSEDQLYESPSKRVGGSGNRLSLKF